MKAALNWNNIDTVCLDMDGTVLDLHFDNHFWLDYIPQVYAKQNNLSITQSRKKLYQQFDQEKGKLQWYCLDFWSERLQLDIAKHKTAIAHRIALRQGSVEFLEFVRNKGKQLYLVTNAHHHSMNLKIATTDIAQYFNEIICAHDQGLAKEQVGFWSKLQQQYPFELSRTLFIDDSNEVLLAAQNAGIKYIYDIAKPDSQQPDKPLNNFPQLQHFSDIMD